MNRDIQWTIYALIGDAQTWSQPRHFPSKKAAVTAMDATRKPKTAVTRVGHTFIFKQA